MDRITLKKIENFFKQKFNNKKIKIEGRVNKDDSAEVFIEDLGWIGFDISNGISPDERYVVISKGFDYNDVVPVKGIINGNFIENQNLELTIDVLNQ